jgi:hypothetical protein
MDYDCHVYDLLNIEHFSASWAPSLFGTNLLIRCALAIISRRIPLSGYLGIAIAYTEVMTDQVLLALDCSDTHPTGRWTS